MHIASEALKSPVPDFTVITKSRGNGVITEFLIIFFPFAIQTSFIYYFRDRIGLYQIVDSIAEEKQFSKVLKYLVKNT